VPLLLRSFAIVTKRSTRNRKRSQRRALYCLEHGCYLDSASRKYPLYADRPEHLQQRGFNRKKALTLVNSCTAVPIQGEWLEALWCEECGEVQWYHIKQLPKTQPNQRPRFDLSLAPIPLWKQASGVIYPDGNPSVGEFTRREARKRRA
jgi:hypothetical protein